MDNGGYKLGRVINVSNRLPVKITRTEDKITYQSSEGGLATGLGSVFSKCENIWIGWPGAELDGSARTEVTETLQAKNLHPVFLNKYEIDNFYEGFSNEIIWPLFHYFTTYGVYSPEYWDAYIEVNRKFANEILKHATEDDMIWIQDYHLMLVPEMLRKANPNLSIGYFQHIPFPSNDVFKALPWKDKIIEGLLGADVVGFQTDNDAKHFAEIAGILNKANVRGNKITVGNRSVTVAAFPISIDYDKYHNLANHDSTKKIAQKVKKMVGTKIMISIDRLDYSKGIIQRLKAFDLFLKKYPQWRGKVTFIHLVVPSRENVGSYKKLKEEMNRLVSDINGKYATLSWTPIRHFYRSFPPNLLSALYRVADLALVTPLVDGMNLVSKEYIASNISQNGALLLGEGAGAANELTESIIINPNDITSFAEKMDYGLSMPAEQKRNCISAMQEKIKRSDIFKWATNFLTRLKDMKEQPVATPQRINADIIKKIDRLYAVSAKRLILLDYDGTLVPFYDRPEDAKPNSALLNVINKLAADKRNDVVIISGRDNITLEKWLGHLPVKIVAEHGAWFKDIGGFWQSNFNADTNWKEQVAYTFSNFSDQAPGTFIEEKAFSVAWHYRTANMSNIEGFVDNVVKQLRRKLSDDLDILLGNKVIEIRNKKINKGNATLNLIADKNYDFIMAIGDDKTDEDMFSVLPSNTITIKVGSTNTVASFYQPSYKEVNFLLKEFTNKNATHKNATHKNALAIVNN